MYNRAHAGWDEICHVLSPMVAGVHCLLLVSKNRGYIKGALAYNFGREGQTLRVPSETARRCTLYFGQLRVVMSTQSLLLLLLCYVIIDKDELIRRVRSGC